MERPLLTLDQIVEMDHVAVPRRQDPDDCETLLSRVLGFSEPRLRGAQRQTHAANRESVLRAKDADGRQLPVTEQRAISAVAG